MSLYSMVLHNFLDRLPNQITEEIGEPFFQLAAKLFPMYHRQYIEYAGLKFSNPFGIASGWADSFVKIKALHELGAGAVVSKTITFGPKEGNPYPRYARLNNSMVNSMGIPNKGLQYWATGLQQHDLPISTFLSIKGNSISEWRKLIRALHRFTPVLELNLSCPNVKGGILDINSTIDILESIKIPSISTKIFLKLSPQYNDTQLINLIDTALNHDLIDGVTAFNTKPVKTKYVGNPTKSAGYSGPKLYPRLLQFLELLRSRFSLSDLPVFALGGIQSGKQAEYILSKFNAMPFFLTGLLLQGPLVFRKWLREFSN